MRNIIFFLILGFLILVTGRITTSWGVVLDRVSFIIGIGVALLTGFVVFWLDSWWSTFARPYRPQSVKMDTKETPAQISRASLGALFRLILIVGVIVAVAYLILRPSP